MSPDPSGLYYADPSNPQSLNLYSYAQNNPLRFVDPTGLYCAWEDGTSDDDPSDGGASQSDCNSQGGHWTNDSNPCKGADNCTATFDWNKPTPDQPQINADGTISYVPGPALSVDGLKYSGCMLNPPSGNYKVSRGAIDVFQPAMAGSLTAAISSLNSQGITPVITDGFRTAAMQDDRRLAASSGASPFGAAKGISAHQVGLAADFGVNSNAGNNAAILRAMTAAGLKNGASFKPSDPVHYSPPNASKSQNKATAASCGSTSGG